MSNPYNKADWIKLREEMLADRPVCHWCKRATATTLDHLLEVDRGGTNSPDNVVPACHKCNSKRGAEYLAKKRANQVAKRKNQKKSELFFENEKNKTDRKSVV